MWRLEHGNSWIDHGHVPSKRERVSEIEIEREEEIEAARDREIEEGASGWRGNITRDESCIAASVNGVFTTKRREGGEGGEDSCLLWLGHHGLIIYPFFFKSVSKITSLPFIKQRENPLFPFSIALKFYFY